jgi:hypothetical protein
MHAGPRRLLPRPQRPCDRFARDEGVRLARRRVGRQEARGPQDDRRGPGELFPVPISSVGGPGELHPTSSVAPSRAAEARRRTSEARLRAGDVVPKCTWNASDVAGGSHGGRHRVADALQETSDAAGRTIEVIGSAFEVVRSRSQDRGSLTEALEAKFIADTERCSGNPSCDGANIGESLPLRGVERTSRTRTRSAFTAAGRSP